MLMYGTVTPNTSDTTITLTTGTLSTWVQNLTTWQMSITQVAGYLIDSNNNAYQVVGSTKNDAYNYAANNAYITQIIDNKTFKINQKWPASSNVKIIISAPMYDLYGVVGRNGETIQGPPYPSSQNPIWYNSEGQPPFFLLAITITDTGTSPSPYTTFSIPSDITANQRGMQVGLPVSGGVSLDGNSYTIPQGSKVTAVNLAPTSGNPTFTIDHQCIGSGGGSAPVGVALFNFYSHSLGAGFNGADQGGSVNLGPMGFPNTSLTVWADTVWTSYPGQLRYGSGAPYLTHTTGILQTGSYDDTLATFDFIGDRQNTAAPNLMCKAVWPATANFAYGPFLPAGDNLFIGGGAGFMYSANAQRGLFTKVGNIIKSSNTPQYVNCATTNGNRIVTAPTSAFPGIIFPYARISGPGIPYGAFVDTVNAAAGTFSMNLPATATATSASLGFYTNVLNPNSDSWTFTEIDHPWADGLERGNQTFFYSNPNTKWTSGGVTYCGDGYVYSIGTAIRFPYQDLLTNNPFGNAERWLGSTSPTWTGTRAKSYVVDTGGTTPVPETSGWIKQDVIQNRQELLGLVQQNAFGAVITSLAQRSDGTYIGIGIAQNIYGQTERGVRVQTAPSLTGPWTPIYPNEPMFAFNNIRYSNTDYTSTGTPWTYNMWMYAGFFHTEKIWPGKDVDDFAISYTNHTNSSPGTNTVNSGWFNPQKYWTNMWVVSGL